MLGPFKENLEDFFVPVPNFKVWRSVDGKYAPHHDPDILITNIINITPNLIRDDLEQYFLVILSNHSGYIFTTAFDAYVHIIREIRYVFNAQGQFTDYELNYFDDRKPQKLRYVNVTTLKFLYPAHFVATFFVPPVPARAPIARIAIQYQQPVKAPLHLICYRITLLDGTWADIPEPLIQETPSAGFPRDLPTSFIPIRHPGINVLTVNDSKHCPEYRAVYPRPPATPRPPKRTDTPVLTRKTREFDLVVPPAVQVKPSVVKPKRCGCKWWNWCCC